MSESSSAVSNGVALRALAKKVLSDELLTWQYDESVSTEKSQSVLKRVLADAKALVGDTAKLLVHVTLSEARGQAVKVDAQARFEAERDTLIMEEFTTSSCFCTVAIASFEI
eukprot:TRINITY_DN4706_c0_g1_i1.p1 TRINITY_DN4706_c0_g1~~TRINITY_DN4706_c0_g1_i1.p1  ORF type:complete len:126 (+),score=40.31 TRINITY_DN4706_c0_g1_i1:43-378(+)